MALTRAVGLCRMGRWAQPEHSGGSCGSAVSLPSTIWIGLAFWGISRRSFGWQVWVSALASPIKTLSIQRNHRCQFLAACPTFAAMRAFGTPIRHQINDTNVADPMAFPVQSRSRSGASTVNGWFFTERLSPKLVSKPHCQTQLCPTIASDFIIRAFYCSGVGILTA